MKSYRSLGELTGILEAHIAERVDAISAALPRTARTDDTAKFLANVRNATANSIKQAPAAAQRALAATQRIDAALTDLVSIIEDDPSLTQALLRYANSAYYATGGPAIVSLKQAAQRIGISGVHNVVLSSMVNGALCKPGSTYQPMVDQVHAHMVRTAPLARVLARAFQVSPDEAYALGLLHDVGKLVIFDILGSLRHQLRRDVRIDPSVVRQILTQVHEPFGGLAAIRWSLGASVAASIASHHRTTQPEKPDPMGELLFVAERADHARQGVRALELEQWWTEGALTTPMEPVTPLLDAYLPEELAAL